MKMYPSHLNDCVEDASDRFLADATDVHKHYELVCSCGHRSFELFLSNRKSVMAVCSACGAHILVYDLAHYPAAVKIAGPESFSTLDSVPTHPAHVFIRYEYGEPEPDVDFDPNAITWCQIFVDAEDGNLVQVFDDETA
jgi:hypothetical protein